MLFAIDLHEDFIDEKRIAVASVFPLQPSSVYSTEFDAPEATRFSVDYDAALCQKILDIPVAEVEMEAEPDGIGNDIWRESMAFIPIHPPIIPISEI